MTQKKRLMIFGGLSALTLVGCGTLSYFQYTAAQKLQTEVKALQTRIEDEGNVQSQLDEINLKVQESRQKLVHLEQGVPPLAYIPTMMTEIEDLGRKNQIQVLGVRPLPPKFTPPPRKNEKGEVLPPAPRPYEEQDLEIKGTGEYLNVLAFVSAIERFPKIVKVQQITLVPKSDTRSGQQTSTLEITIELRAFLFKQDAPMASEGLDSEGKPLALNGGNSEGF